MIRGLVAATALGVAIASQATAGSDGPPLLVGANYHPHDWPAERWPQDIALMRAAGFNVVRLGHLCWDSFEPRDGDFQFEWFDRVMDQMAVAGLRVILDIPTRPAPIWLHRAHPSVTAVGPDRAAAYPQGRYYEDIGDPFFRAAAQRLARTLTSRYARHPALLAFGLDNELGAGRFSYSESARQRFVAWLQSRHGTIDALNHAWSGQRWSRRIGAWDEIEFPGVGGSGAPERELDRARFYSDEVLGHLRALKQITDVVAPGGHTASNIWHYNELGFDYQQGLAEGLIDQPGLGFYGVAPKVCFNALLALGELEQPFWAVEFMANRAAPGTMRTNAYLALTVGARVICGWTWRSMSGGEEQFIFGLLDHDGTPSRRYEEYARIAHEFQQLGSAGLPYRPRAEVAIAYSFASQKVTQAREYAYPVRHLDQALEAYTALYRRNRDCRIVDLRALRGHYKLLIVPGCALLDEASARTVREFVQDGGTAIMTALSAEVDENNHVFTTPRPGRLVDVFGVRVGDYEEVKSSPVAVELAGEDAARVRLAQGELEVLFAGAKTPVRSALYEVIEPRGAKVIGTIGAGVPIVTENMFGRGRAIYVGVPATADLIGALCDYLAAPCGLTPPPIVPAGIVARDLDSRHRLLVNPTDAAAAISLPRAGHNLLSDGGPVMSVTLPSNDAAVIRFVP
jgi:beta-galactosidase